MSLRKEGAAVPSFSASLSIIQTCKNQNNISPCATFLTPTLIDCLLWFYQPLICQDDLILLVVSINRTQRQLRPCLIIFSSTGSYLFGKIYYGNVFVYRLLIKYGKSPKLLNPNKQYLVWVHKTTVNSRLVAILKYKSRINTKFSNGNMTLGFRFLSWVCQNNIH